MPGFGVLNPLGCGVLNPLGCAGGLVGGAVGSATSAVTGSVFGAIAGSFASAADGACNWLWGQISGASVVSLDSGPGSQTFGRYVGLVAGIAVFVAFILYLVEIISAVLRQDGRGLTHALKGLVVAFLGTSVAIAFTVALLEAVDALASGFLQVALGQTMDQLGKALLGAGIASTFTNPAAQMLFALVVLAAVVIVWAALMIRKLLIIIAAVFAPLAFAGGTSRFTSGWVRKWIEATVALVLSKLILVVIFVVGYGILVGGLGEPAHPSGAQRVTNMAVGALTLAMAGLAPWMALKTVHFSGQHFEHVHGQVGNATAGAATAAGLFSPQKLSTVTRSMGGGSDGAANRGNGQAGTAASSGAGANGAASNASKAPSQAGATAGGPAAAAASRSARAAAAAPGTVQP
jgi:type IV secretion system protein TrbL